MFYVAKASPLSGYFDFFALNWIFFRHYETFLQKFFDCIEVFPLQFLKNILQQNVCK